LELNGWVEGINDGSKDSFEKGCLDGIMDGSYDDALLGLKLGAEEGS
jgi:hypothetical protein